MHLPSAGMIRFRFDGFTVASQPSAFPHGHPEVKRTIDFAGGAASGNVKALGTLR